MEISGIIKAIISLVLFVAVATAALFQAMSAKKRDSGIVLNARFLIMAFFALLFASTGVWFVMETILTKSRYGFETTDAMEWTKTAGQGGVYITQSSEQARFGKRSLRMDVDLKSGDENRSKSEVYVEIPPQNLESKPITAWVYVPEEAIGQIDKHNGIQLFVKDTDSRSQYGSWWKITRGVVNKWQKITLIPSRSTPKNGYTSEGFDPTQITVVGIKCAVGDGSTATYKGPIYIDAVDWL